MSGCIAVNEKEAWIVTTWAFDRVLHLARKYISSDEFPRLLLLMDETKNRLRYIDLVELSVEERMVFREAVMRAYKEAAGVGAECFIPPDVYLGFMDRFRELLAMLEPGEGRADGATFRAGDKN